MRRLAPALLALLPLGCGVFDDEVAVGSVHVVDDDNADGRLSPGESARLEVTVEGYDASSSVRGTLSTSGPVAVTAAEASLHGSGGSVTGRFGVEVSPAAAVGEDVAFSLGLSASDGQGDKRSDTVSFALRIEATGARPEIVLVEVTDDDNDDGAVNKGETVRLRLHLRDAGTSDLPGCEGVLVSSDPFVAVTHDRVTFGDVEVGETETGHQTFAIEVDEATPAGHAPALTLQVTDDLASSWALPVPLTVAATGAQVVFSRFEVADDDDDDGLVEAGEDVSLKLYLKNAGTSKALGVDAVLSSNDALLAISGGSAERSFGDLDPGEEGTAYQSFRLALAPETPRGHAFELFLTITDDQANSWAARFPLTEGASTLDLAIESARAAEVGGDGDGLLEAGEVGSLELVVRNRGTQAGREVRAELTTEDGNVRLDRAAVRIGNVGPGGTAPAEEAFRFTVLASHPGGPVPFSLTLTAGNYRAVRAVEVEVLAQ